MALFQHAQPEQAENPLPPALPGEVIPPTNLHRLRLRQLQDLAAAYGIDLPEGATKNEVIPIMVTHERAGRFRQPPVSRYALLHAEINHDEKLEPHQRQAREAQLKAAEREEFPERTRDPDSLNGLRARCKELGLNSYGKNMDQMRKMIADAEASQTPAAE